VASQVTIHHHLLTATSGMWVLAGIPGAATGVRFRAKDYFPLFANDPPEFKPGESGATVTQVSMVLGPSLKGFLGQSYLITLSLNVFC